MLLFAMLALAALPSFAEDLQPPGFGNNAWLFKMSMQANPLPSDSLVLLNYTTLGGQNFMTYLVTRENGSLAFYTPFEIESITFTYDDKRTPSDDGTWSEPIREKWGREQNTSQTPQIPIELEPIGEVAGTLSNAFGAPVGGALVEIDCTGGFSANTTTSPAGTFAFPRARAGECLVAADANGLSAKNDFSLTAGEFKVLDLQLKKPEAPLALWAGAAIAAVIAAFLLYQRLKPSATAHGSETRQPKHVSTKAPAPQSAMPSKRQSDLLATLDAKEKRIVEFVMHYHPGSVRVSKLRRELLIPKTSLTRTLQALERKQFLKIEKIGTRMFARLHDFFMNP